MEGTKLHSLSAVLDRNLGWCIDSITSLHQGNRIPLQQSCLLSSSRISPRPAPRVPGIISKAAGKPV